MKKIFLFAFIISGTLAFQYCSSSRKVQNEAPVTYEGHVHPVIMNNCSPCHTGGKQETLNNYEAARHEIDEIVERVQKNPDEKGFMPFKHPKLPDSTISIFVKWKQAGMPER